MTLHAGQDESASALLVIDMVSTWGFPGGRELLKAAVKIAPAIARLKARCKSAGVPVVYANDNHGRWRSDWRHLMDMALAAGGDGAHVAHLLAPDEEDYFVLKPMHSAFFATPLHLLLQHLQVHHLILTGVASDQCVWVTASAARMHSLQVSVPRDGVAAPTVARTRASLRHFEEVLKLSTTPGSRVRLQARPE
jgi:nicotinamidase-related amidase